MDEQSENKMPASDKDIFVYTEKHVTYEKNGKVNPVKLRAKNIIRRWIWLIAWLVPIIQILSIVLMDNSQWAGVLIFLLNIPQTILYIILMVRYKTSQDTLSRAARKLLLAFVIISGVQMFPAIVNFGYNDAYTLLFFCGVLCVVGGIRSLYLSHMTKQSAGTDADFIERVTYVKVSNIELELAEAKRLFEKELITVEEYESIRRHIFKKYYGLSWNEAYEENNSLKDNEMY